MKILICLGAFFLLAGTLSAENYQHSSQSTTRIENGKTQDIAELTVKVYNHPELGSILTDGKGMTLYIFTPDKDGASTCYDQCAIDWPPLLISSRKLTLTHDLTGKLDTTDRRDNKAQVTYNGMPLYYYVKDKKPGDAYGQNVENKWFVIQP